MMRVHAAPVIAALLVASGLAALGMLTIGPTPVLAGAPLAFAAGYALVFLAAQRSGFRLQWRGHGTRISMEEFALVGGVLLMPPALLVASIAVSALLNQALLRRAPVKAAFNIGQYMLAGSAAAAAYWGLRTLGAEPMWAAVPAPFAFSFVSQAAMAALFARLEGVNVIRVFRDRFLTWSLVTGFIGISLGMAAFALWLVSPVAVLTILPIFVLLVRFGRLTEWAEEEARLHQALAAAVTRIAQNGDLDECAHAIVDTTAEALGAGEVRLRIPLPGRLAEGWTWTHPDGASERGLRSPIVMPDGPAGEIEAFPRVGPRMFGARQQRLLDVIAASAASVARTYAANLEVTETNRRLTNANRELEEFTLWTTHDMREPLRSVGQLAQILRDDVERLSASEVTDLAERIARGADGLKDRIKALHEFSRVVQQDVPFADVDLAPLVAAALSDLSLKIQESGARVEIEGELPTVRGQDTRLEKVFANLIENALKYNDKPVPRIVVSCQAAGERVEVSVRDNGPGVEASMRERIFQLFQRGAGAQGSGSGAGLAIVKRIVEQHGGRAWVTEAPGGGADFRFTLPRSAAAAPSASRATSVLVRA